MSVEKINRVLRKSIIINIILVIFKILIGYIGHSRSMIADGVNSVSDLITDFIAIFGNKMSNKKSNKKHPFGYGKIEYLTSILVGFFVLFMGIELIINAFSPNLKTPDFIVLVASIVIFFSKYAFSLYMLNKGKEYKNSILISSSVESRAGAMTTLFVMVSFILSRLGNYNSVYLYSDNICTLLIGVYVIYISYKLLKENFINVIGVSEEDNGIINKIKEKILINNNVIEVNDVSLIKYGSYYSANIEIVMKKNMKLKDVDRQVNKIKKSLISMKLGLRYIKISVVPNE